MVDKLVAPAVAGVVPVLADTTGTDTVLIDVANRIFEGDREPAKIVVAVSTFGVGALLLAWTYLVGFNGFGGWDSILTAGGMGLGIALVIIAGLVVID